MKTSRLFTLCLAGLLTLAARAANEPAPAAAPAVPSAASGLVPCKIHRTKPVAYPLILLRDGISHGEARILINIDAQGQLTERMILGYTHRPFADAAIAAIDDWRFEPARQNGEAVGTVADVTFRFEVDGILLVERSGPPLIPQNDSFGPGYVYKPHGLRTLDKIPTPIQLTQPLYPKDWIDQGISGNVTIDFYIDETGAVRMPSVASTNQPLLAAAAASAVKEWKFAPPLRKGRPVLAHCQQVFNFAPDTPKP